MTQIHLPIRNRLFRPQRTEKGWIMAIEGLKLTLVGMSIVYVFLALLVVLISLTARLLRHATQKEQFAIEAVHSKHRPASAISADRNGRVIAVIGAALAAHRARLRKP
jgi:sodium pump decarboxylase gamma subunit